MWPVSSPVPQTKVQPLVLPSPSSVPASYNPLCLLLPLPMPVALPLCQESHRPQKALLPRVSPFAQVQTTRSLGQGCRGTHWPLQGSSEPPALHSPAPRPPLWLAAEEAAAGPHTRPGVALTGALWKVTAATTKGFEDQTVCAPHSYLWPRRPPPPMALAQRWGLSRSQLCGCPQDSQARPAHNPALSLRTNLPQAVKASPVLETQVANLSHWRYPINKRTQPTG